MEMIFLNAGEYTQLQRQVLMQLMRDVDGGAFLLDESMGNEQELAKHFEISRSSMRGILQRLGDAGVIEQLPRRGIFLRSRFRFHATRPETMPRHSASEIIYLRWDDSLMEVEISCGLEEVASTNHLDLRILSVCQSLPEVLELIEQLRSGATLILVPMELPGVEAALARALARGVRILQLDRYFESLATPAITFDDYGAGVLATRHLIEQHDGPVWFFGYKHPGSCLRRWQGWKAVMEENGFYDTDHYLVDCAPDAPDTQFQPQEFFLDAFRRFARTLGKERVAVYCICDLLAVHVYTIAAEFNLQIGRDLLVTGSGDVPFVQRLQPPLSSLHVDQTALGRVAGRLLLNWPTTARYRQMLPLHLIARDSSRPTNDSRQQLT